MRSPSQPWLNRLRCTRWRWSYEHEQHCQTLSIPRDHPFSVVMSFVPAARAAPAETRHSPHANLLLDRVTLMAALQETAAIAARGRNLPAAAPGIYYCRSAAAFKMFDVPERLPAHDDMARAARAGWNICICVDWYISERCSTRAVLYLMPCLGLLPDLYSDQHGGSYTHLSVQPGTACKACVRSSGVSTRLKYSVPEPSYDQRFPHHPCKCCSRRHRNPMPQPETGLLASGKLQMYAPTGK